MREEGARGLKLPVTVWVIVPNLQAATWRHQRRLSPTELRLATLQSAQRNTQERTSVIQVTTRAVRKAKKFFATLHTSLVVLFITADT
jgi:hypothetical protein